MPREQLDKKAIQDLADQYIRKTKRHYSPMRGVTFSVSQPWKDDLWWYATVTPSREFERHYAYYEMLAEAEQRLKDDEGISLLLIPSLSEPPRPSVARPRSKAAAAKSNGRKSKNAVKGRIAS